jgi:hypothetical protein
MGVESALSSGDGGEVERKRGHVIETCYRGYGRLSLNNQVMGYVDPE